ncbi:MAG: cytochrome c [Bacteroidetes bacterium]|nr:cytochrome c [Bacteroidota bacterium]
MTKKYVFLLAFILLLLRISVFAQSPPTAWVIPEEAKEKVAPFIFTVETVKSGESLFQKNCKSCHGDPGKQNWAKIAPPPGDPASAKFQKQADGEIFFKVTTGKTPMPQFGNILSVEERWQVISYLRSFNSGYMQPAPLVRAGMGYKNLRLHIYCNYRQQKLYVLCTEILKDKKDIPAKGIEIQLNVKRYFGWLKTGEPKSTNAAGFAFFDFPADLPGGEFGILDLAARVKDETGNLNANEAKASLAIGKPVILKSLTDARAMWSVRSKAPLWLILTFSFSLITVWGFIFYILVSLIKLKQIN